jgi:cyanophycin synthetase
MDVTSTPAPAEGPAGLPRFSVDVRRIRPLMGPNVWRLRPVLEMVVDIGEFEDYPTHLIPGFVDRLMEAIPSLYTHKCSEGVEGGFLTRMREGTWIGHVIEHIALELQYLAGHDEVFGQTRSTRERGVYRVVFAIQDPLVGEAAARQAVDLAVALANGEPFDVAAAVERIAAVVAEYALGPSTRAIVQEAERRGIPWFRLNDYNLVQFGYGCHQQRIQATTTSLTGMIATDIACDKQLTRRVLQDSGIPVPQGGLAGSEEEALALGRRLGFPLVCKPQDGNQGKGLTLNITDEETLRRAFHRARQFSPSVVVEKFYSGHDYRVLVVGNEVVAVARRQPAHVVGDGVRSVRALVEEANKDPRRGIGHEKPLTRIPLDATSEEVLAQQGWSLDDVPPQGQVIYLRWSANLSTGGTAADFTDRIHVDNAELCVRAVLNIGLDIAGIDIISPDLSRPMIDNGGVIVEVNAAPGFRMHLFPSEGQPRDVASPVVDMLFPLGAPSRIPIISVTGTNGKTTTARLAAHILKLTGKKVGLTTTDGIYVDGKPILRGDMTGPWSARVVLRTRTVDAAVLETARGGILRGGLGFDRCDVGVLTNISADHLGMGFVETLQDLANVKATVLEVVNPHGYGVLNAEDELVCSLAERCPGKVCYFSLDPAHERFLAHRQQGGVGITVEEGQVVLYHHRARILLLPVEDIPCTLRGTARFNVANALAATLACYLLGVRVNDLREGLSTFTTSYHFTPGRQNLYQLARGAVLVDYAHNPAAYQALSDFVRQLRPQFGRILGCLAAPGDRLDEHIYEMAATAAATFDEIILKEDADLRGRAPGETASMLEEGLRRAGFTGPITHCHQELAAVEMGIRRLGERDLLVVTVDDIPAVHDLVMKERPLQQS